MNEGENITLLPSRDNLPNDNSQKIGMIFRNEGEIIIIMIIKNRGNMH